MLQNALYQPSELSSIRKQNSYLLNFHKISIVTSERSLLVSIFHMMLGLPSQNFILDSDVFTISLQIPEVPHLNKRVLVQQLQRLLNIGNMLQYLRTGVQRLKKSSQKILQAFGSGLQIIQVDIERKIVNKLKTLHQEEGNIKMNQSELLQSKNQPISLLEICTSLSIEKQQLTKIHGIISQLPNHQSLNNEDMHRASIFLLNYHYQQCQIENLTQTQFSLNIPFRQCLKVYLDICKSWISFDEAKLFSYNNCGFFVDLTRAISMDGDRFFDVAKIVRKQLIPELFSTNFMRIVQLGKTVQFIKLYFKEQQLLLFHRFLDTDNQFSQLFKLFEPITQQPFFDTKRPNKSCRTISQRCVQPSKHYERKLQKTQDNPFNIFDSQPSFLQLRFNQSEMQVEPSQTNIKQSPKTILVSNRQLLNECNQVLERIALKCKIVLKQKLIKDSIQRALRCIKQFVLLGQGDFTRQFLQRSWLLLQRSTDRISRNNVERIIQQAIKVSALATSYEQFRDVVSFVFLRTQAGTSKGWRAFSLTFKAEKPVNFIFNSQAMHDYESIGNLLFCLRHCENILVDFWRQSIRSRSSLVLKTRITIQRFLTSLETYIFIQIESSWNNLLGVFETCDSILTLLEANKFFLEELKKVTVQNKPLCNSMLSLVKIVDRIEAIGKRMEENPTFIADKEMEQILVWFLSLLDQAKHIPQLADSFDFNFDTTHY